MTAYGFEIVSQEEASEMGLLNGTGLFRELFLNMLEEIKKNKYKAADYDQAPNMTSYEKKISFLNRYFIYKKIRTVNTENVELELGEYQEAYALNNKRDTRHAQQVAQEEVIKIAPKVRKLSKKLLLVAATDAIDYETNQVDMNELDMNKIDINKIETIQKPKKTTRTVKPKIAKKIIIEDEDEN